jgi:hypothetical protein
MPHHVLFAIGMRNSNGWPLATADSISCRVIIIIIAQQASGRKSFGGPVDILTSVGSTAQREKHFGWQPKSRG